MSTPPTRWAQAAGERNQSYGERFAALIESGEDVDGEARLADALLPRHARVLDVGAGMGRVAAALSRRGHDVLAVEPEADLVEQARRTYPGLRIETRDALSLTAADGPVDLAVCVGNVMIYLAPDTERTALAAMRSTLAPDGRILVGFHLDGRPPHARDYTVEEFEADAAAAGLRIELRAGGYDLRPADEAYGVWVLARDAAG